MSGPVRKRSAAIPAPGMAWIPAWAAFLILVALPCWAGNHVLASGSYGGSLGAGAATAAERIAWGQTPAAIRPGEAALLLHLHRPFGLEDLRVVDAGAAWDARRLGFGAAWRQTAVEDLYSEQGVEAQAALRLGRPGGFPGTLDLGAAVTLWRREIAGMAEEVEATQGYGLVWRMLPNLAAGVFARALPLARSPWDARADMARVLQAGVEARAGGEGGRPEQALRFDFRRSGAADWRALAALSIRPHRAAEAVCGIATAPFEFSLGLRLAWSEWALHQAFRHHRDLGATWLTSLGWTREA